MLAASNDVSFYIVREVQIGWNYSIPLIYSCLKVTKKENPRKMPFSHHSHSGQFCSHGDDDLESIVMTAIQKGMQTLALTEHMPREERDFYPEEVSLVFHSRSFGIGAHSVPFLVDREGTDSKGIYAVVRSLR